MKIFMIAARFLLLAALIVIVYLLFGSSTNNPKKNNVEKSIPKAIAGIVDTRISLHGGGVAILNGASSYDPDGGEIVNYRWVVVDTPRTELLGEIVYEGINPSAPNQKYSEQDIGVWIYELEVTDDDGQTDRATKTVFVHESVKPIFNPEHTVVTDVDFMIDSDPLLGLIYNGEAIAYPAKLAYPHSVINDVVGEEPVYIVYCEACQSGVVKKRTVDGVVYTFDSAGGTLEEEEFLIHDQETKTTWHAVYGEAEEGELAGTILKELPYELTTWGEWKEKYPKSLVFTAEKES